MDDYTLLIAWQKAADEGLDYLHRGLTTNSHSMRESLVATARSRYRVRNLLWTEIQRRMDS